MYRHLCSQELLPNEQKGCRKNSRGRKDQLLIDKAIPKNCRRRKHMTWFPIHDFGMCKIGWSGPKYNHPDREQYGKLKTVLISN